MRITQTWHSFAFSLCLMLFMMLLFAEHAAAQQERTDGGEVKAWIIPVRGNIEPSLAAFVRRETRKALNQGVDTLIFEIDTFGGRVDSTLQITSFIMSIRNARTVAWINSSEENLGVSWSAGAIISFACSSIYMAPGTSIGAAAPVIASPSGTADSAGEKNVAAIRSQIAAFAERNGHPVSLALAMVDFDVELWEVIVDGEIRAMTLPELERLEREARSGSTMIERVGIISEPGKLLSLTAGEAQRYGLTSGLVDSRESLLSDLGVSGEVIESIPSAADGVISFLTSGPVQAILILLGLVMIFLEIQSPGFGIPGVTAIIAFLVVFGASALLGRVGSLEIILFLIGIGLLAVELFVIPGFGVMGISGIFLIGLSLVLSMQDFVIPRFDWEWAILGRNVMVVFVSLIASIFGIAFIALLGPKLRLFDPLTLKTAIVGTAGGPDPGSPAAKAIPADRRSTEDEEDFQALVGKIGTTDSILRPSGRAVIDGKIYTVEADGEFVDAGREVVVTRVRGNRIGVKSV